MTKPPVTGADAGEDNTAAGQHQGWEKGKDQ